MENQIDRLVNVQISIESQAVTGETYDRILIVGADPVTPNETQEVAAYTSLARAAEAGWKNGEPVYDALAVAFSQYNTPRSIVVATRGEDEDIRTVLERVAAKEEFYGIYITEMQDDDLADAEAWADENDKLLAVTVTEDTRVSNSLRTLVLRSASEKDDYAALAWMALCFGYDPGSETWAYKALSGITPGDYTSTQKDQMDENNVNYYVSVAGADITYDGKTCGGEFVDNIRFRDWLLTRLQLEIFQLFVANRKIPFTDAGIALVENRIRYVLKQGQEAGGIAADTYDGDNLIPGFTVSVPAAKDIPAAEKKQRRLSGITFQATLAGAIHLVEIRGSVVI